MEDGCLNIFREGLAMRKEQIDHPIASTTEFNSGPQRIASSNSASQDSSIPLQVSAALQASIDNSSQQSPSVLEVGEHDVSLRSESIKVLHFERSDHVDSLVDLGAIDRTDDCPQTDSKLFLTD